MAFFKKLFNKNTEGKIPRGFNVLTISKITRLADDTVMVSLDVPTDLKSKYNFVPGQYLDFLIVNMKFYAYFKMKTPFFFITLTQQLQK